MISSLSCMLNLKRVGSNSDASLDAARISNQYIFEVGQTAAPTECVLPGTRAAIRCTMKSWVISERMITGRLS